MNERRRRRSVVGWSLWIVVAGLPLAPAAVARAQPDGAVDERLVRGYAAGLDSASPDVQAFALGLLAALADGATPEERDAAALLLLSAGVLERAGELAVEAPDEGVRQGARDLLARIEGTLALGELAGAPAVAPPAGDGARAEVALPDRVAWLSLAAPGAASLYELDLGFVAEEAAGCGVHVAVLAPEDRSLLAAGSLAAGEPFPLRAERAVAVRLARRGECRPELPLRVAVVRRARPAELAAGAGPAEAPTVAPDRRHLVQVPAPGDAAWFAVAGEPGGFYVVETSRLDEGLDTVLELIDPASGAPLRESDDAGPHPLGSRLVWRADAAPRLFRLSTLRDAGSCEVEARRITDPLPVGEEVAGELAPGTTRQLVVAMEKGYRYSLAGTGELDGVLTLFGPGGEELASNDDFEGTDPRIDWIARESGSFLVELAAWSGGGAYRLRADREEIGELLAAGGEPVALEPGDEVAGALDAGRVQELTFAAAAGRGYVVRATGMGDFDSQLTLLDAGGGTLAENDDFGAGRDARLDWQAPADGTYRIQLREYGDRGGEYTVSLLELPAAVSIAAAGERAGATPVEVGVEVAGSLPPEAPQWLRFAARAGHAYRIEAAALPLDTRLWLYSEAAGDDLLAMNDDREAEDWEPRIDWLSEEDTAVYLRLDERDGTPGAFRLSVREIEPSDALREAAARRPFDGHAVGDRVRLGRHRPIDGVDNWDPGMEPWVGQAATIEELVGQESDTGAWVVRVDVDGGEWVWRTADLGPADGD